MKNKVSRPDPKCKWVFGPVKSRRLGRSLGIDVLPPKTCTYDCIYCQAGPTTTKTTQREPYAPPGDVADEVLRVLSEGADVDYVTFSGSGEPTLYSQIGTLIRLLKAQTDNPVAVITNGSLLWRGDVQDDLKEADLVMPSLDAGDQEMFARINRPPKDISFEKMVDGIAEFRKRFAGELRLEVLLLAGITDEEVEKIADHVTRIGPDRVQINTVVRRPAEKSARAVPRARLEKLAAFFDPPGDILSI